MNNEVKRTIMTIDAHADNIEINTGATFLDIPMQDWLQGQSIMPLITWQRNETHDAIFTELSYHSVYNPKYAVHTKRHNYVRQV